MGQADQSGEQGQRRRHRQGNRRRSSQPQAGYERQADEEHPGEGDHHGEPREDHGSTCGVECGDHRLGGAAALAHQLPVATNDEQGVVDAHAQSDHHPDQRGDLRNGEDVGEQRDQPERRGTDAGDGDGDRQPHREHRAEGQNENDDREREADQLRLGRFEAAERPASDLDTEAVDAGGRVDDAVSDLAGLGAIEIRDQVQLGVGDIAVGRDLGPSHGPVRVDDGHLVERVDLGEHGGHRQDHVGVVDPLVGFEDDRASERAGRPGEVVAQSLESPCALGRRWL